MRLDDQKNDYENKLSEQYSESQKYRNQVHNNLHEQIPDGEKIIINIFKDFFRNKTFIDFTIYNQLAFNFDGGFSRVDFLVVSPRGLFVIESKCWKGVTYVYRKGFPNIFYNTEFDSFGLGSNLDIQVFNVNSSEKEKGKLIVSKYDNPIAQARGYSRALANILPLKDGMRIKNIVVFNKLEKFVTLFNNEPLEKEDLDSFSSIITDSNIKSYFDGFQNNHFNTQNIVDYIDHNLGCLFKMDINNYGQAPFDLI